MKIPFSRTTLVTPRAVRRKSQIAMAQALGIPPAHRKRLENDLRPLSAAIQHTVEPVFGHAIRRSLAPQ
ncbi:hypothetical protein LGN19_14680 [Burkholderia sp. AU30198]|uniref:hypothetical protein n=1 Tax=Burkholderia sp. AU30198 TaxID=2879627 RepID=UPI001CF51311|nr:hypothetical protein [Burkholderia sp. AU30198]MCA8295037.1 hypothetical protein [Burkholderia sp. AU30198]